MQNSEDPLATAAQIELIQLTDDIPALKSIGTILVLGKKAILTVENLFEYVPWVVSWGLDKTLIDRVLSKLDKEDATTFHSSQGELE
jgi:hypothetical protein